MNVIAFNTGIEHIISEAQCKVDPSDHQTSLTPSGLSLESHTERLFDARTTDQQLEAFVKPVITSALLIDSTSFNKHHQQAMAQLKTVDSKTSDHQQTLNQAHQLLQSAMDNTALLSTYRRLLIQA